MANHPLHRNPELMTPLAVIIGSIIIAGSIMIGARGNNNSGAKTTITQQQARQTAPAVAVDSSKVVTTSKPMIGNPTAQLTIAYWYDYQCPFCKRMDADTIGKIVDEYVTTGKAKLVFKDFQFLGADSTLLGQASRAVWEVAPAKFYSWHKAMFAAQGQENSGWAKDAIASVSLSVLGAADTAKMNEFIAKNSQSLNQLLIADKTEGTTFGVKSTPSLVIGNKLIVGAQPYVAIKAAIDSALAGN